MSHLSQLQFISGCPESTAVIRQFPEDFRVVEELSFEPSGNGQHVFLFIEKQNMNTETLANQLAKFTGVRQVAIGYAGLKDRNAITRQWFSVDLAGKPEPDWSGFNSEQIKIVETIRHDRKLKRGAIRSNHFQITLRQISGDQQELQRRLESIQRSGVPNYFGEQRFGRNDANLEQAKKLFLFSQTKGKSRKRANRHLRSIYLSAVRSYLFNQVLSKRVEDHTWNQPIEGDIFMLNGTQSIFTVDAIDEDIIRRVNTCDIHPTGPMWGGGEPLSSCKVLELEQQIMIKNQEWCDILVQEGLSQERRSLRSNVSEFIWDWNQDQLQVEFDLLKGCYATSVIRELVNPY